MAKLYFRYGTVGSAKTLNLLAVAHNYQQQEKKVLILQPEIDTRYGKGVVKSRSGLEKPADHLISPTSRLDGHALEGIACVLVDEVQFLNSAFIDHLRDISRDFDIPVICYGLRTDFKSKLFEGAQRLFEVADAIEEVKNTCHFCNRKAVFNLKTVNGKAVVEGPSIELGTEELYVPACAKCYHHKNSPMTKKEIVQKIVEQLEKDLGLLVNAAKVAREDATHEESKAEDKYDTRGLEASYLAGAQAKRASEIQQLIKFYKFLEVRDFGPNTEISATALVKLESKSKKSLVFIVPKGGGTSVEVGGVNVQIITPVSRIGEELMGKSEGDEFHIQNGAERREYVVLEVR